MLSPFRISGSKYGTASAAVWAVSSLLRCPAILFEGRVRLLCVSSDRTPSAGRQPFRRPSVTAAGRTAMDASQTCTVPACAARIQRISIFVCIRGIPSSGQDSVLEMYCVRCYICPVGRLDPMQLVPFCAVWCIGLCLHQHRESRRKD